jgi:replicative DNA helicase
MIQDVETERAVLGCVLGAGAEARQVASSTGPLPPEAFTEGRRHVWEAILSIDGAVDHLTLSERLRARGRLAEVGGPGELMVLDQGVPLTWNLPAYVVILRDRMVRRQQMAVAERLQQQASDIGADAGKASLAAVQALSATSGLGREEAPDSDIAELAAQWAAYMDRLEHGAPTGLDDGVLLRTGVEQLDAKGEGMPSNLCVLLGLASMGKTALAAEIIWNWLKAGIPGGIVGLEDGTKWLTRRHLARHLGLPVAKIGRTLLHEYQQERLGKWMGTTSEMYRNHLRIHRAGGLHASDLLSVVTRWINAGVRWVWIDHGLRVDYGTPDQKRYDLAIGKTLEALSTLGERHGVVIAVNWHLNRLSDQETKPDMKMAKESGYLEAAARWMVATWEQKEKRPGMMLATALKATEGPRDWTVAIERDPECALVKSAGGYVVDFAAEADDERQRAEQERLQRQTDRKGKALFGRGTT